MADSVLDAIRDGHWDYEPEPVSADRYESTLALPGTPDKVSRLAQRAQAGLPLWHPADRRSFDESEDALR